MEPQSDFGTNPVVNLERVPITEGRDIPHSEDKRANGIGNGEMQRRVKNIPVLEERRLLALERHIKRKRRRRPYVKKVRSSDKTEHQLEKTVADPKGKKPGDPGTSDLENERIETSGGEDAIQNESNQVKSTKMDVDNGKQENEQNFEKLVEYLVARVKSELLKTVEDELESQIEGRELEIEEEGNIKKDEVMSEEVNTSQPTDARIEAKNENDEQPTDARIKAKQVNGEQPTDAKIEAKHVNDEQPTDARIEAKHVNDEQPTDARIEAKHVNDEQPTDARIEAKHVNDEQPKEARIEAKHLAVENLMKEKGNLYDGGHKHLGKALDTGIKIDDVRDEKTEQGFKISVTESKEPELKDPELEAIQTNQLIYENMEIKKTASNVKHKLFLVDDEEDDDDDGFLPRKLFFFSFAHFKNEE